MPFDIARPQFANPVTGRTFTGETNVAALLASGIQDPHWATFVQWKGAGRIVRKGEKGTLLFGRGFKFRVFAECQTAIPEATATPPAVLAAIAAPPVDPDFAALASDYICDAARKLYWLGKADALDADLSRKVATVTARNDSGMAIRGLSAANRLKLQASMRAVCQYAASLYALGSVTPIRSALNDAKPEPVKAKPFRQRAAKIAKTPERVTGTWQKHPVTGWSVRPPQGADVRDVIPFGRSPALLKAVGAAFKTTGRIGAANVVAWLRSEGRTLEAGEYSKRVAGRRREEGRITYNYGPGKIDLCDVVEIVEYDPSGRERKTLGVPRKTKAEPK